MMKVRLEKKLYVATESVAEFIKESSQIDYLEEIYNEWWLGGPYDDEMTEMHVAPLNSHRFKMDLLSQMKMIRKVLMELKKTSSKEEIIVNEYLYDYLSMDLAQAGTKKFLIKTDVGKLYTFDVEYVKDDVFTLTEIPHCYQSGRELECFPDFSGQSIKIWTLCEE